MASRGLGQDLLVGVELGHYRVVEKIGAGGMGEVYRACDQHLARDVAIKVLPPGTLSDESARKHFHKEALILSQLNHPNVATIHDFDTQQGVDFLVMEYIPGITLSEKLVLPGKGSGNTPLASEAYPPALDPMMSVCCWRLTPPLVGRTNRPLRPCM